MCRKHQLVVLGGISNVTVSNSDTDATQVSRDIRFQVTPFCKEVSLYEVASFGTVRKHAAAISALIVNNPSGNCRSTGSAPCDYGRAVPCPSDAGATSSTVGKCAGCCSRTASNGFGPRVTGVVAIRNYFTQIYLQGTNRPVEAGASARSNACIVPDSVEPVYSQHWNRPLCLL